MDTILGALQTTSINTAHAVARNQTYIAGTSSTVGDIYTTQASHGIMLRSISDSTSSIQQQMAATILTSNLQAEDMRVTVRSSIRDEIPALRDAVLGIFTSKFDQLSEQEHIIASQLTPTEQNELQSQIRNQLLVRPSSLREAADFVSLPRKRGMFCDCRSRNFSSFYGRGALRIEIGHSYEHQESCPYHSLGKQSWRYTVSARLLPFVQRTVALGLSLTSGSGCFSIAPLLNAYCTVERSKSPVFKLFDDFPSRCARQLELGFGSEKGVRSPMVRDGRGDFRFEWDMSEVEIALSNLHTALATVFLDKLGSGSDKDENGNTVLHVSSNDSEAIVHSHDL